MTFSTIPIKLSNEELAMVSEYARSHNISLPDLYRNTLLEKIEDEIDLENLRDSIEASITIHEVGITQDEMEQLLSK